MADERYTRCPGCTTIFRVTPQQLALRGGQVRCGHCKTVFDGNAELISLAPRREPPPDDDAYDEAMRGPPTVTLRSSQALEPHEPSETFERMDERRTARASITTSASPGTSRSRAAAPSRSPTRWRSRCSCCCSPAR